MLIKLGFLGRLGGIKSAAQSFIAFALNILGLNDTYGNVGTFTRAGAANVTDYAGALVSVPTDVHRVTGGRYSGGVWTDAVPINTGKDILVNGNGWIITDGGLV